VHFVAENAKTARAFLKSLPSETPLQQIEILELNEHTAASALPQLLAPALAGNDLGLISEAGCPRWPTRVPLWLRWPISEASRSFP
jgi:16S rRNA (cytidine1402-2'-O)-methyltransferase